MTFSGRTSSVGQSAVKKRISFVMAKAVKHRFVTGTAGAERRGARRILPEGLVWTLESLAATALGAAALLVLVSETHRSFLYFRF